MVQQFKQLLTMVDHTTEMVENLTATSQEQGAAAEEIPRAEPDARRFTPDERLTRRAARCGRRLVCYMVCCRMGASDSRRLGEEPPASTA